MNITPRFGDKEFYKKVIRVSVPSMLQQMLSSCMGIIDTMMVAWIGMVSAVGIGSQLEDICFIVVFGVMEGIGIFAAQFFGAKDYSSMKKSFGLAALISLSAALLFFTLITFFPIEIISFYVKDPEVIRNCAEYLSVVRFSYFALCLNFTFSYMFRCMQKTSVPMYIGVTTMVTNCICNYILIFGHLGLPAMGVKGAALGTVIAQCLGLVCYITYAIVRKAPFIGSFNEMFSLRKAFVFPILQTTYPVMLNETLFGFGQSMYIKAYALLGTTVTDAYYVGNTITRLFFSICNGLSVASGMMLGAQLGAGERGQAITESRYFLTLSFLLAIFATSFIIIFSSPIVSLFNLTDPAVRQMAVGVVRVSSVRISLRLVIVVIFASLRAGGDAKYLMFLDSGVMWLYGIPLTYFLVMGLGLQNFIIVFLLVQSELLVRMLIGIRRFLSNKWAVNLTTLVE